MPYTGATDDIEAMRSLIRLVTACAPLLAAGGGLADAPTTADTPMTADAAATADAPMTIAGATTVDADGVIELILAQPELVVIDARRPEDYAAGHIERAVNLPSDAIDAQSLARLVRDQDTPLLFYCNGVRCGRAADAAKRAIEAGYRQVYYYALGMAEWQGRALPLASE
jgi:rhodanese-related sulfurtransferase